MPEARFTRATTGASRGCGGGGADTAGGWSRGPHCAVVSASGVRRGSGADGGAGGVDEGEGASTDGVGGSRSGSGSGAGVTASGGTDQASGSDSQSGSGAPTSEGSSQNEVVGPSVPSSSVAAPTEPGSTVSIGSPVACSSNSSTASAGIERRESRSSAATARAPQDGQGEPTTTPSSPQRAQFTTRSPREGAASWPSVVESRRSRAAPDQPPLVVGQVEGQGGGPTPVAHLGEGAGEHVDGPVVAELGDQVVELGGEEHQAEGVLVDLEGVRATVDVGAVAAPRPLATWSCTRSMVSAS